MYPIDVSPFTPSLDWLTTILSSLLAIPLLLLFIFLIVAGLVAIGFIIKFIFSPSDAFQWLKDINPLS